MIVYDPLYGPFETPAYLDRLILTPEVRRLSQVRLLNSLSPSVSALAEVRRYSHTLGVLYLCRVNSALGYSEAERKALAASVLLHDIGTPPFGHLFEYHLREIKGWTHEGVIRAVLWGYHAPENKAHQIFAGRTIEFQRALRQTGISFELVEAIVTAKHPLAALLFGTIDLDNLDNVARMSWGLGLSGGSLCAMRLASELAVSRDSRLLLRRQDGRHLAREWARLRRSIYEILTFDPPTAAAQAVLSDAISTAFRSGILSGDDWSLTDEALLEVLRANPETKDAISREYLGRVPSLAFYLQIDGTLNDLHVHDRAAAKTTIEKILRPEAVLGYVFVDRGTFEKRLAFFEPVTDEPWEEGDISSSVVLYGFLRSQGRPSPSRCRDAAERLLSTLNIEENRLKRCQFGAPGETNDAQYTFNF